MNSKEYIIPRSIYDSIPAYRARNTNETANAYNALKHEERFKQEQLVFNSWMLTDIPTGPISRPTKNMKKRKTDADNSIKTNGDYINNIVVAQINENLRYNPEYDTNNEILFKDRWGQQYLLGTEYVQKVKDDHSVIVRAEHMEKLFNESKYVFKPGDSEQVKANKRKKQAEAWEKFNNNNGSYIDDKIENRDILDMKPPESKSLEDELKKAKIPLKNPNKRRKITRDYNNNNDRDNNNNNNDSFDDGYVNNLDYDITSARFKNITSKYIIKPKINMINLLSRIDIIKLWEHASDEIERMIAQQYGDKDISVSFSYDSVFKMSTQTVENNKPVTKYTYLELKTWSDKRVFTDTIKRGDNLKRALYNRMKNAIERFANEDTYGSGWAVSRFLQFEIFVNARSLVAQKYFPLLDSIKNKGAVINIKNEDEDCFLYSLALGLYHDDKTLKNANQPSHYKEQVKSLKDTLVKAGLYPESGGFDVYNSIKKVKDIENLLGVGIAILTYITNVGSNSDYNEDFDSDEEIKEDNNDKKCDYEIPPPMHIPNTSYSKIINLLYMERDDINENEESISHFAYIKDVNKLINTSKNPVVHCPHCFKTFRKDVSQDSYLKHIKMKLCYEDKGENFTKLEFPNKFENHLEQPPIDKSIVQPFCMYGDFETHTDENGIHLANTFGLYLHCDIPEHCDKDVSIITLQENETQLRFFDRVWGLIRTKEAYVRDNVQKFKNILKLSPEEQVKFDKTKCCEKCGWNWDEKDFTAKYPYHTKKVATENDKKFTKTKCRDHCHLTGKYRWALCSSCNFKIKENYQINLVMHNFSGFDSHLFLQNIHAATSKVPNTRINVLTQSRERVISFDVGRIRFIDSYRFIAASLSDIVKTNAANSELIDTNFSGLKKVFGEDKFKLFLRKGVYPYNWVKSVTQMESNGLPDKKEFFNILSNSNITKTEYDYAVKVYNEMECKSFKDFHDIYLKTDVILLADVFNVFRKNIFEREGLEPLRYYTLPSLAYDSCLKAYYDNKPKFFDAAEETKYNIEMFDDTQEDMWKFCRQHLRGGYCCAFIKHLKANNPKMKDYDPKQLLSYILYVDANSLYPFVMGKFKNPRGNYRWNKTFEKMTIGQAEYKIGCIEKDDKTGYIFDVDLIPTKDPEKLKMFEKFPPLCESRIIDVDEESPYNQNILKNNGSTKSNGDLSGDKSPKLVGDMKPKTNYKIAGLLLKQVLEMGAFELVKINNVLEFDQGYLFEKFVNKRYAARKEPGVSEIAGMILKLILNSFIGKFSENQSKYNKYEILKDIKVIKKRLNTWYQQSEAIHHYYGPDKFNEETQKLEPQISYIGIESNNQKNKITRALPIGTMVLDYAKYHMNDFIYNCLYKTYNHEKVDIAYTDTDSIIFKVSSEDKQFNIYDDIKKEGSLLKEYCDEKILGGMKLEYNKDKVTGNQNVLTEVIVLCEKMYSVLIEETVTHQVSNTARSKGMCLKSAQLGTVNTAKNDMGENIETVTLNKNPDEDLDEEQYDDFYMNNKIEHSDYKNILYSNPEDLQNLVTVENRIQTKKHILSTVLTYKSGFNAFSNKRYVCNDGIHTHAYGYLTPEQILNDKKEIEVREALKVK
jgi:hypothetical protein